MFFKPLLLSGATLLAASLAPLSLHAQAPSPDPVTINAAEEITAAALAQIKAQERLIQQLRSDQALQRQQLNEAAARLAAAEGTAIWMPWLVGLVLALLALVVVLAAWLWQLRGRAGLPAQAAGGRVPQPAAAVPPAPPAAPSISGVLGGAGAWPPAEPTVAGLAPMVSPPAVPAYLRQGLGAAPAAPPVPERGPVDLSLGTGVPPREVSVEEMLDLEQQVDFFVVLGQEEAAIDLLLGHLRATGGASASPYLKLLEIYASRGDEAGYERIQSRFNQRFNAQAPGWGGNLQAGYDLEHHGAVVARLQLLWPSSADAVAALDELLHPRAGQAMFDLPAFRDLLMLQGVASDLLASQARPSGASALLPVTGSVDLLLPLDEEGVFGEATAPQAWQAPAMPQGRAAPLLMPPPDGRLLAGDDAADGPDSAMLDLNLELPRSMPAAPREFTQAPGFSDVDLFKDSRRSDFAGLGEPIDPTPSRRMG